MKISFPLFITLSFLLLTGCSDKKEETNETVTATDTTSNTEAMFSTTDTSAANAPGSFQMQPPAISPQGANTPTAPGMNPPHGQPGHDCAIAVGAPLGSKPTTKSNTQMSPLPTNTTPPTNITSMPSPAPSTPTGPTPEGMNPPHGQPGHDCAIAVGAPLKKK